jgi:hypothetical protein
MDGEITEALQNWEKRKEMKKMEGINLHRPLAIAVAQELSRPESWATPQTRDNRSGGAERWDNPNKSRNLNDQIATATTQNAKLNPRWVCALMNLPVFWVKP